MKKRRASRKKWHIIYKTTCTITNKFYIGMHSTDDLGDEYIGSGTFLWHSIKKYGKENHQREILEYLLDRKSLRKREKEIVTEDFIKDSNCMNLREGGDGLSLEKAREISIKGNEKQNWLRKNDPEWSERLSKKLSIANKKSYKEGRRKPNPNFNRIGQKHKPESIEKIKLARRLNPPIGEKNGSFGSKWIHNEKTKEIKRCKGKELKELLKNKDWKIGRKISPTVVQRTE